MAENIDFKRNSLNLIRFLAAFQVMYMHAYVHMEVDTPFFINEFVNFFWGVPIFFTLSGFLIWQSIGRSHSYADYAKKRFWRIYPELWIAVAVEIIVLLALYKQPINWFQMGLFTIGQATIFQFWTPDFLRGYGVGCPNGALWTISILIQFYFCAFFIYRLLNKKSVYVWGGVFLASVIIGYLSPYVIDNMPVVLGKLYGVTLIPYLWMFLLAAFVSEYKDRLLLIIKKYWWCPILLLLFQKYVYFWDIKVFTYYIINTVLLFTGLLGFSYAFPQLNIKTDISYALYIYHMTIVNAMIVMGYIGTPMFLCIALFISIVLSYISTITIGKRSAKIKSRG